MSQELENLQLKAEELLYKCDKDKLVGVVEFLEIEAIDSSQTKGQIIKVIRKAIDAIVEGVGEEHEKISRFNTLMSHLDESVIPPLEKSEYEKQMISLQNAYADLQKNFELQKQDILSKLEEAKKKSPAGSGNENSVTGGTSAEITGVPDSNLGKPSLESNNANLTKETLPQTLFRREFKITG